MARKASTTTPTTFQPSVALSSRKPWRTSAARLAAVEAAGGVTASFWPSVTARRELACPWMTVHVTVIEQSGQPRESCSTSCPKAPSREQPPQHNSQRAG